MKLNGVFLDRASLGDDIELNPLTDLAINWTFYSHTCPEETLERCLDMDVVISNKVILDQTILEQLPRLKHIAVAATGTNNVDKECAKKLDIQVSNVVNYASSSVAQLVFSLILELVNHTTKYAQLVQQGKWSESRTFCLLDFPIMELAGKTMGLIGYGSLAKSVEHLAKAFGMRVLIAEHKGAAEIREGRTAFDRVLKESDIVSLHCPLNQETENLIGAAEFALMKPSAILINTARGGIISEQDLVNALATNTIAGAAIDVLTQEPPSQEQILLNTQLDNLIVTPHIAWASQEARLRLITQLAQNIKNSLKI